MYYAELYDLRTIIKTNDLLIRITQSFCVATLLLLVCFYVLPVLSIGRGILGLSLPIAWLLVVGWRILYRHIAFMPQFRVYILVIGSGEAAKKVAEELMRSDQLGYEVKGFLGDQDEVGKELL